MSSAASHVFRQVDVFSAEPLLGNPVAVVHDADDLTDEQMAAFARWTNLSETTFLLTPTDPAADYRLRIFTPGAELPFAGHPTLGSAHAWLEAGGVPAGEDVVQECGAGLVRLRRGEVLAFEAPPLTRSGPVDETDLEAVAAALRVGRSDLVDAAWIDNGPGWVGVLLRDADAVLALEPDFAAFGDLKIGAVGEHVAGGAAGGDAAVEVRAFCPQYGVPEDPVTGSLNAGIGQWLAGTRLPASYVAAQGTAVGRRGRVHVARDVPGDGGAVHVGGATRTTITGTLDL
ncbi:PhzF family phenazine biosynthesis protein [Nocardioides deserti]|uniref:PhzF family phenazine biosynthesis protein n=1 Tax=Nocardioides deserti TaxID=1588644 RepID=A0ABR6U786_9ACTN|nr:PhzF family phenazine biosynthesis protein [Nocardioides deserti]